MRRSMMRPALSMHHNPYDSDVAQAFYGWLTQTGLLAVLTGTQPAAAAPTLAAPTTPKPGDLIPPSDLFDPAAWLALPIGSILAFGKKGSTDKVPALVYRSSLGFNTLYFTSGNTALSKDKSAEKMATAVKDYDAEWIAWVSYGPAGADTPEARKAAFLAVASNLPGFDGWKFNLEETGNLPAAATAAAAEAKPTLPGGMKYLSASTDFSELDDATSSSNGALIWLQQPDGAHTIWYHAAPSEWGPIEDSGSYSQEEDNKSNYAFKVAAQAASYIVLLGYAYPDSTSRGALIHKLLAVFPGAASPGAASPETLAALKELHAYIKADGDKVGMAGAIMLRINKKHDDYFSSAFGSDFDGYGTPIGRAKFLSKLTDFGITKLYGVVSGGKKAVMATPLGVEVATAWVAGYSDPALLGKKPKAAKAAKAAKPIGGYMPSAEAYAQASTVHVPESEKAKAKKITSIAESIKDLAPLIKEAAAKVTGVVTEAGAGGITMDLNGSDSSVRIDAATTNTVTFGYFKDNFYKGEKTIPIPVPDTAGTVASAIAQAMVYFLVYSDKSEGKVFASPPSAPGEPMVVDGVPLVTGANLTTQAQIDALPNGSILAPLDKIGASPVYGVANAPLPATLRYLAMPDWDTYAKPLSADPAVLAQQGVVFPAPKAPGWPAMQIAPTLATYSDLPVGTLLRTDFSGGSVFAARVDAAGYQKVDSGTGGVTSSTKRSPTTLVQDAAKNKAVPYILYLGKGTVPSAAVYKQYIEGKRADLADTEATTAASQVEMLAGVLGIDPRVAALFSPKVLEAMIAQKGLPYMGSSLIPPIPPSAKSPLLKNPHVPFRSNPEKYRSVVQSVLGVANPSKRQLLDAELLDAAGLPLEGAAPRNRRRNPEGGSGALTNEEMGIVKAISDALKAALGSGEKPSGSTTVGNMVDYKLGKMYGKGDKNSPGVRPETGDNLAAYLRYLVAARAAGLWKNYIDPGEREVTRGLEFSSMQANDPSQSVRVNADGLSQIEVMKAAGKISTPVKPYDAMTMWLKQQASGNGWFRADVDQPWQASSNLTPPSAYDGKLSSSGSANDGSSIQHWNTYQRAEGGGAWKGKLPYPAWAAEPWANVEGFCVDYHDPTFKSFTATEWSAPLGGFAGVGSFLLRANTRDPRFVLLPGSDLKNGPMTHFQTEGAIVFVTVDEKPLKAEVVSNGGGTNLTMAQLAAWIRARPAYPTGPKPVGPAAGIAVHRNPARTRNVDLATVHAILFDRSRWGPGAVRHWLAEHGLTGFAVRAAGDVWRVEVYAVSAFRPGSIKRRDVGNDIFVMVGKPV